MKLSSLLIVFFAVHLSCSGDGQPGDPCEGVDCSGHGECNMVDGQARCTCAYGYTVSENGKECIPDSTNPCADYDCSGFGRCHLDDEENPYCDCDPGYYATPDGLDCLPNQCEQDCGPIGCCGTRCCRVLPSNHTDIGEIEISAMARTASGVFNTNDDCTAGSALGDCQLVELSNSPDICVCRLDTLIVSGSLTVTGQPALAVLALSNIAIDGTLDISANRGSSGPGAESQPEAATSWHGGRGGTFGTLGGNSGVPLRGAESMIPLMGGQAGQAGCSDRTPGGGGGAVQLTAGTSITVAGLIDASCGGGQGGAAGDHPDKCVGAAGGGSGGGILLEAPSVTMSGAIFAHGGGGGGGGSNDPFSAGTDGEDATPTMTPAQGGIGRDGTGCALYQAIEGGDGGTGSVGDQPGNDGQSYDQNMCEPNQPFVGGGGGGGGSGRIRVNSLGSCNCVGTFSPSHTVGFVNGG